MKDSAYWMNQVLVTAKELTAIEQDPARQSELAGARKAHKKALRKYTDPFGTKTHA